MKSSTLTTVSASTLLIALASISWAEETPLFDRGLPLTHVNEASIERSNIILTPKPELSDYLLGDDFILPGKGHYTVTTIRVWSVNADDTNPSDDILDLESLVLWGGLDKKSISAISSDPSVTPAQYDDGQTIYIGYLGGVYPLYQIDFTVNLRIKGGQLYDFFLDDDDTIPFSNPSTTPFLHASNASKSGNLQQGADDTILFLGPEGDIFTYHTSEPTSEGGTATWDKDSDINVQVFGTSDKKKSKPAK